MNVFKNKYRIASARAHWWDYGWAGAYFITICTQNRKHYFGEIQNGAMCLSDCGVLANAFWQEIPKHTQNAELGAFVVMPNHIHGILLLNGNIPVEAVHAISGEETLRATSLQEGENVAKNMFMAGISPKPNTISTIIRSYKTAVTKHANRLGIEFAWQSRFYDHIIRNDDSYQKINDYIEMNPVNWEQDKFFSAK